MSSGSLPGHPSSCKILHRIGRRFGPLNCPERLHSVVPPVRSRCADRNGNPPLSIRNVPANARTLALIVDDPDAPRGTWVHWVLWDMGPDTTEIPATSVPGEALPKHDFGKQNYGDPCPPSEAHQYFFSCTPFNISPPLNPGARRTARGGDEAAHPREGGTGRSLPK